MTADERERRIRVRNARHATPDCLCDWCFILGRLDGERGKVARVERLIELYDLGGWTVDNPHTVAEGFRAVLNEEPTDA